MPIRSAAELKYIQKLKTINALGLEPGLPPADRRANNRYVAADEAYLAKIVQNLQKEKKRIEDRKKREAERKEARPNYDIWFRKTLLAPSSGRTPNSSE